MAGRIWRSVFVCVWLLQFVAGVPETKASKDLLVTSLDRTIDVATQLVKINTKLTLSNGGQSSLKFFHFAIEDGAQDKLSYIGATVSVLGTRRGICFM